MISADVLESRAKIEQDIEGLTICHGFRSTALNSADVPAYTTTQQGEGSRPGTLTWGQAYQEVRKLAAGFVALGLAPGERVALMMANRTEHVLADLAAVHAGGLAVTFYATLAPEQIAFIAADCGARIVVLDGAEQLARWRPVLAQLPQIRRVVVLDSTACPAGEEFMTWDDFAALGAARLAERPGEIDARTVAVKADDPVALLYTSGTTGEPKGVLLTHHNILYETFAAAAMDAVDLSQGVRWVSYLPLAHIAERMFSIYLPIYTAGHVNFCPDPTQLVKAVGGVRPTAFFGVPRVWQKMETGIEGLLGLEQDEGKRAAVAQAMAVGREYVQSRQYGHSTPAELAQEFQTADQTVLGPIRALLGLGEADTVSSAAAPLPPDVAAFFAGLGMAILDIYGMTETTGACASNSKDEYKLGTVGRPFPGIEVRTAEDGEILVRGPINTPGYLNRPDLTAQLIDPDGWLHTGDIGSLDADGFLSVVDRKKELIITAGGENIAPAGVENALVAHPLIGQALAFGDRRPYVVALLTLDSEAAVAWARARGIDTDSVADLAGHPDVLAEVGAAVAAANERLARVQQVKRWRLLPAEWTPDTGELTPTLKLKRRVIHGRYADVIDALYEG
ncbi:MAG TPA: AMP-binding protein [Streptosporangiaceae bacterium]|nr:AMP-binding protein [Streptosporangiaceae bacterium]